MAETNTRDGSFASDMGLLLESSNRADVTLVVGDSELPAHSQILAARSPVFAAMLQHDMREARSHRIEIIDVQEAVLKQLLLFMYSDTAPELPSMAAELLASADKYDLPLLKDMCEEQLENDIRVDNAASLAVLAVLHSCKDLKCTTVEFIARNIEVMATEGWMNAMQNNVEAASEICRLVVEASSSSCSSSSSSLSSPPPLLEKSILSESEKQKMAHRLTVAAAGGQVAEVKELLAAGAAPDSRDSSGFTALHRAVMRGNVDTVQCLLAAGADVNARDSSQQTPLHEAVFREHIKIMWMLFARSANVNATDRWGKTPLHWVIPLGNTDTVKALRLAGANKLIQDVSGKTPADLATTSMKDF